MESYVNPGITVRNPFVLILIDFNSDPYEEVFFFLL